MWHLGCTIAPDPIDWRKPFTIAPVAQLDRASGYEPEGRVFESPRAHHRINGLTTKQKPDGVGSDSNLVLGGLSINAFGVIRLDAETQTHTLSDRKIIRESALLVPVAQPPSGPDWCASWQGVATPSYSMSVLAPMLSPASTSIAASPTGSFLQHNSIQPQPLPLGEATLPCCQMERCANVMRKRQPPIRALFPNTG